MYEMCQKKHAFNAQNINGLAVKILKGEYSPIGQDYSQELRQTISQLLQVHPESRPALEELFTLPLFNSRILKKLENVLDFESITLDNLNAVEAQTRRLLDKRVFTSEQTQGVLEKLQRRRVVLEKERQVESMISRSQAPSNSEYSTNFEIDFEDYAGSSISNNLESRTGSHFTYEGGVNQLNPVLSPTKRVFQKRGKSSHHVPRNQEFDGSFEKEHVFEPSIQNLGQSKKGMQFHFRNVLDSKVKQLKERLLQYLGAEKFDEVLGLYREYDESDIDFKSRVAGKILTFIRKYNPAIRELTLTFVGK